ncbi:MAG TPA: PBP1A family penicillin-binding protein [Gaiellaceae bacterium]|nr:PBP1A family penicillin-binding protein [Gaiellaceae bacterium]
MTAVAAKIPQLDPSRQRTQANTYVYAANNHTILSILRGSQARIIVPSQRISPWVKHAIIAIEDKRFYEHRGVDLRGMARALWADVSNHGTVQGGSTITQQFVKNAYLTNQKTVGRKLIEAALAWQLEQKWSKDKILTAYLNTVYFGNGAYGVEQAARIYFHHSAAVMKPAEAALLAGIPEDPSLWDPVAHPQAAKARRNLVLKQLYVQQFLTTSQYVNSLVYPMPDPAQVNLPSTQGIAAPYFANYVKDQLVHTLGPRRAFGGGLRVTTTLDMDLQQAARNAIASVLPPRYGPTAALVALDAQSGAVLAMVGGRNYHQSQFNLATQGERQPGSAFKPFVLATALRENISPSSVLTSSKHVTINVGDRLWQVNNYEGEALGPINLSTAITVSDNSVFSQLTALVGPQRVAQTAHDLGITTPLQGYFAIGLGAEPATPLEMARAYASFADGGKRIDGSIFGNAPRAVEEIKSGSKLDVNRPVYRPVLSSTQADVINQLLQGVVQSGTGTAAALPGRAVAGKTGTTENYGDAWFVGYTPQFVVAVWVGYPDKLVPMLTEFHGHAVAGGTFPALIWKSFMQKALALKQVPPQNFEAPPSLYSGPVRVVNRGGLLERDNGVCHNSYQLEFYGGQGPARIATCKPNEVEIPDVVGQSISAAKTRLDGQPLTSAVIYKPAKTGERLGYVVGQFPRRGTASAYDKITLVLAKSLHGVIPRVVGLRLPAAERKLSRVHMKVRVHGDIGGRVVSQSRPAHTASAPGLTIVLTLK